jgi:NADH-quinone oxidoreductase subunit C
LFGIYYILHTDLRKILTDYGFKGFPLRKDFPLSGFIELKYDDSKKAITYTKIKLVQEFRTFKVLTP